MCVSEKSGFTDDGFLLDMTDNIDNSVSAFITAVSSGEELHESFEDAASSLCVVDFSELDKTTQSEIEKDAVSRTKKVLADFDIDEPDDEDDGWDMELVSEVEEVLEGVLQENNVATCHPWKLCGGDESICYSTCERCEYCQR